VYQEPGPQGLTRAEQIYAVLLDPAAEADVRVAEEGGAGYLLPADSFAAIVVPKAVELSLRKASW
jgi:hypothetical protein